MVGALTRAWRRERGWKQSDVVKRSKGRLTQTYLSKLERGGIAIPTRPLMEALADVYEKPIGELYRAAGVLEGIENGNSTTPAPASDDQDRAFDPAQIVAYVEAKPDPKFQAQLAHRKRIRTPESYTRLCLRIYRAWSSQTDVVMAELEAVES